MRIFERLRGWDRSIERKLAETIAADLLRRMDEETPVMVVTESKSNCCSCCSARNETRR